MKRRLILAGLIVTGVLLLLTVDAWVLGGLAALPVQLKTAGPPGVAQWWEEWSRHPVTAVWGLLTAQPPAGDLGRKVWLLLHIPLAGGTGYLVWLIRSNRKAQGPKQAADYGSHGAAHLATEAELAARFAADGPGLILGKLRAGKGWRWLIQPVKDYLNQFLLIFGSAGTFKSTGMIITNTLHETEASLVLADPKAEVYRATAAVKKAQGYQVRVIDYERMERSLRQNPLHYVRQPGDAVTVAAVVIHNTENPNKTSSSDSFWDQAEQALMTALILYVKLHRPPAEQNLGSVLALGTELNQQELNAVFDAVDRADPARKYYRTFRQAEDKTRASILLGFANRLQLWNLTDVEAFTATTDFELADLTREKTVLYVHFPLGAKSRPLFPLMALLWTQICDELINVANSRMDCRLPFPVRFRIDEAANIGHIPDLEMRVSTTRGLGIWWELIFQNLPQFRDRYRAWSEIAGSCDTLLFFGGSDQETLEYISRRLGRTTIQIQSVNQSHNQAGQSSEGEGATYTGRDLLDTFELATLDPGKAVLLQRSRSPAIVAKPFYEDHALAANIQEQDPNLRPAPPAAEYAVTDPKELPAVKALSEPKENETADPAAATKVSARKRSKKPEKPTRGDALAFLNHEGGRTE